MPQKTQKTTGRFQGGKWIRETKGADYDPESRVAASEASDRARKAFATGAKPVVSDEEPKDKNSLSHLAWRKRQKNRSAAEGANALASR